MKSFSFDKTLNSQQLKENVSKLFNVNVNLDKYDREQLEDIRNQLRTKVFQYENQAGFNELLTNETYQKDKAILQLLNTRINEMLGEDIKKLKDRLVALEEGKKKSKPDFLDLDKDGNKKEPMKQAAKQADMKEEAKAKCTCKKDKEHCPVHGKVEEEKRVHHGKYGTSDETPADNDDEAPAADKKSAKEKTSKASKFDPSELSKAMGGEKATAAHKKMSKDAKKVKGAAQSASQKENVETFKKNVRKVNESLERLLQEDEEAKAKIITAAGDMVNDFTSWMQRVGQFQTKSMIELADAIKSDFGPAESETFKQAVAPALAATLETLTQQREAVSNAVAVLAGEATASTPMGPEPGEGEAPMPSAEPDQMNEPAADQLAASEPAATNREVRESKFSQRLAESHSIISKLAK